MHKILSLFIPTHIQLEEELLYDLMITLTSMSMSETLSWVEEKAMLNELSGIMK